MYITAAAASPMRVQCMSEAVSFCTKLEMRSYFCAGRQKMKEVTLVVALL
jgi:hypothetical protein